MTMQLDHEQLHRLLEALGESDIQEFRWKGTTSVWKSSQPAGQAVMAPVMPAPLLLHQRPLRPPSLQLHLPASTATRSDLLEVTAPMVGTFYRAPAPGEPAFVEVGSRINVGQTVCILEAMKLMNELESEVGGEVVEILVDNGTPVEFGQG